MSQPVLAALVLGVAAWATAWAEAPLRLTPAEQARLDAWETHRAHAVSHANLHASQEALDELAHVLDGHPRVLLGEDLSGAWKCRTVRLAQARPVTLFPWYDCRITEDAMGLRLEKLGGAWRSHGRLHPRSDRDMIYVDDAQRQVAVVVSPLPDRLRLEFPRPRPDVTLEILELRR